MAWAHEFQIHSNSDAAASAPRARVLALLRWLHAEKNLKKQGGDICRPGRGEIANATISDVHSTLPTVSVANFCLTAQRLGVDARPIQLPLRPFAVVYPAVGEDLEGHQLPEGHMGDPMYLDPLINDQELDVEVLRQVLRTYRVPPAAWSQMLGPAPVSQTILLSAIEIIRAVRSNLGRTSEAQWCEICYGDAAGAVYGALWALTILHSSHPQDLAAAGMPPQQIVWSLVHAFKTQAPEEVTLVDCGKMRISEDMVERRYLTMMVQDIRGTDATPIDPRRRNEHINARVKYSVGQVFRHRRYGYVGVIVGWSPECQADEGWMRNMRIDTLPNGRNQAFYNVM